MTEQTDRQRREELYEQELLAAGERYQFGIYAANVMFPDGEVRPTIKKVDMKQPKPMPEQGKDINEK